MVKLLEKHLDEIIVICKKHHVESISVFGSAATNTMNNSSDIDFLIRFDKTLDVLDYADNYFELKDKLQLLLTKPIDLVTAQSLKNPILISEINKNKIELYAA
jgi:uncharacterized protein